jgi:hypothetical protein
MARVEAGQVPRRRVDSGIDNGRHDRLSPCTGVLRFSFGCQAWNELGGD